MTLTRDFNYFIEYLQQLKQICLSFHVANDKKFNFVPEEIHIEKVGINSETGNLDLLNELAENASTKPPAGSGNLDLLNELAENASTKPPAGSNPNPNPSGPSAKETIRLKGFTNPNSLSFSAIDRNWIQIKIDWDAAKSSPPQLDHSNHETSTLLPCSFECLNCKTRLTCDRLESRLEKTLDLPSDYWFEMTDCWACHHEDYTTLKGQKDGLVFAQEKALLTGISYYLMHPNHMNLDYIHVKITGREVSASICLECELLRVFGKFKGILDCFV